MNLALKALVGLALLFTRACGSGEPKAAARPAPVPAAEDEPTSILQLRCALKERCHAPVRRAAAEALGSLGCCAAEAVDDLIQAIGDGDGGVRRAALDALVRIGPDAVTPLLEALAEPEPGVGPGLVEALSRIVPEGREALASLGDCVVEAALSRD